MEKMVWYYHFSAIFFSFYAVKMRKMGKITNKKLNYICKYR
jgi:hypothetical protein